MIEPHPALAVSLLLAVVLLGATPAPARPPMRVRTAPAPAPAVLTHLEVHYDIAEPVLVGHLTGIGGVPVSELLPPTLFVRTQSKGPVALVLFAFRIRDGSIASRFVSKPFKVEPGSTVRLGSRADVLPPASFYGEKQAVGKEDLRLAAKSSPLLRATRDPLADIIDGTWPDVPTDRRTRSSVYFIAAPADRTLLSESAGYPLRVLLRS